MILSQNEYRIMSAMWESDHPLNRSEILKATEGRNWNPASVHLIINAMISKGAIKITNEDVKYGRTYEPCISYEDYIMAFLKESFPDKDEKQLLNDFIKVLLKYSKE